MKITNHPIIYNKSAAVPTFTEYRDFVMDENNEKLLYRMDTCSFRHDLCFDDVVNFLECKYPEKDNVEFWVHACSIGEETHSFAAQLDSSLGEGASKYYPIHSRDINSNCINKAKNPLYKFRSYEFSHANFQLRNGVDAYYDLVEKGYCYELRKPKDKIRAVVEFKQADIFEDYKNIRPHRAVLAARNFWQYLNTDSAILLAYKLAKHFDNTCVLIIGDCDREAGIPAILEKFNFKESSSVSNVFEKISNSLPGLKELGLFYPIRRFLQAYEYEQLSVLSKCVYNISKFFR